MTRVPMKEHARWLRANGHSLAPLTGTDARALEAIAACWQLYSVERTPLVLVAVRALVQSMQPKCRPLAKALIPWALDWSDEEPVWALVHACQGIRFGAGFAWAEVP